MPTDRRSIGIAIAEKLLACRESLRRQWLSPAPIRHFFLDGLLPDELCLEIAKAFPDPQKLTLRSSLRERKRVGIDLKSYPPIIGEALFAFQEPFVIQAMTEITALAGLEADPTLYASGISIMGKGDFLNPHIDNSHDADGQRYRVLNFLLYASPDWKLEDGGNLELWNLSVTQPVVVASLFNRLVVMETHPQSWHSVSPVRADKPRCCVSNYYFSRVPPLGGQPYRHVTLFAGRPEQPLKRIALKLDGFLRDGTQRLLPFLKRKRWHRIQAP